MNLIEEFGLDRFNQRFRGTFFKGPDGVAHIISKATDSGNVNAERVDGNVDRTKVSNVTLPFSFFEGIGAVATPRLGWRVAAGGKYVVYLARTSSYHRGCSENTLTKLHAPITKLAIENKNLNIKHYIRTPVLAKLVMEPTYLSMAEGLRRINSGELISFAINQDVVLFPEDNDTLALMFRTAKVGTVGLDGTIHCSIPNMLKIGEI